VSRRTRTAPARLPVRKTWKLAIGGAFPRSESGRSYPVPRADGSVVRASRASRKDVRDAVRAARRALDAWSGITAYLRGQVLYRAGELMESRRAELAEAVAGAGASPRAAAREVERAVDRWIWYAGWTDKFAPLLGGVNPVSGPFYAFSVPEPVGVVGVVAPEEPALVGLVSRVAPVLAGGNTAVVVASYANPLPAITLAEILATSDVPAGVVNVLTGLDRELVPVLAAHRDVDALDAAGVRSELAGAVEAAAADNLKRVHGLGAAVGNVTGGAQSPWRIADFTETKSVWHPVGP
jgi:acyl-CoA reductase-like NAD-dependent aldehyde dehydrogenase